MTVDIRFDLSELENAAIKEEALLPKLHQSQVDLANKMQQSQHLQNQSARIITAAVSQTRFSRGANTHIQGALSQQILHQKQEQKNASQLFHNQFSYHTQQHHQA